MGEESGRGPGWVGEPASSHANLVALTLPAIPTLTHLKSDYGALANKGGGFTVAVAVAVAGREDGILLISRAPEC
jgi:hypothetical protein